jgi:hypothetical protein
MSIMRIVLGVTTIGLAACTESPTPPAAVIPASAAPLSAATTAPPSAQLTVLIDNYGSTAAIADSTNVVFDMSGSTGTGLDYKVDFGDGTFSGQRMSRHVFTTSNYEIFTVRAQVTDQFGRTSVLTRMLQVSRLDGSGYCPASWESHSLAGNVWNLRFDHQTGGQFDGQGVFAQHGQPATSRRFAGTADESDSLVVSLDDGSRLVGFVGFLEPIGSHGFYSAGRMRLTGVSGPFDGIMLDFQCHDPY